MLQGTSFLAIWHDIAPDADADFHSWHTIEHMPERLKTPGICIGRRYADASATHSRYYTMYEADSFEVFASEGYYATGNTPSDWSRRVQPKFLNFSRSPCHTVMTRGAGVGGALATIRITFPEGAENKDGLTRAESLNVAARGICDEIMKIDCVTGVHIGLAGHVARRSIRKESLNNRPDIIKFDGVVLVESIDRAHIEAGASRIRDVVSARKDCVGSTRFGIYELAYYLGK